MKCKVTVFCNDELATGFDLAGVNVVSVSSGKEAWPELQRTLSGGQMELVVVSHDIASELSDEARDKLSESAVPIVVDLPLPAAMHPDECVPKAEQYVSDLIQQVIGRRIVVPSGT